MSRCEVSVRAALTRASSTPFGCRSGATNGDAFEATLADTALSVYVSRHIGATTDQVSRFAQAIAQRRGVHS
ncbi:MAG: hypothetical protein DMF89_07485 [Acidobacteria bacterium]|nr:MAG: hypothetical protein DMF89_07485 [Acidobacteriota bacterium]